MINLDGKNLCSFCFAPIEEAEERCNCCGKFQNETEEPNDYLSIGSILSGEFLVGHVLGHGGFGATYLGYDLKQNRKVAIKEYFPARFCYRVRGEDEVQIRQRDGDEKAFREGAERFYNEATNITLFQENPIIIDVYSFFYENNTCYFVMEYVQGITLKDYVDEHGGRLDPNDCCKLLFPVLDAMHAMHEKNVLHRDISPDNIYITSDGTIKLLDFGAARQKMEADERSLSVVLKQGFAPIEQYQRKGKQGPWTDVYALAATIYYCVSGTVPRAVTERIGDDRLVPLRDLGILPETTFSDIIEKAMAIQVVDRVQTSEKFKRLLEPYANGGVEPLGKKKAADSSKVKKIVTISAIAAAFVAAGVVIKVTMFPSETDSTVATVPVVSTMPDQDEDSVEPVRTAEPEETVVPEDDSSSSESIVPFETAAPEEEVSTEEEPVEEIIYVKWKDKKLGKEIAKELSVDVSEVTPDMLSGVKSLVIKEQKISNWKDLKDLPNLKKLTIEHGKISSINDFVGLEQLESLKLMKNQIKKIDGIEKLKNLKELNLYDNELKDITPLKKLGKIEKLNLENNEISEIKVLKELKNLKELNLRNNMILDTDTMKQLKKQVSKYKGTQSDQKVHPVVATPQPTVVESTPEPVYVATPTPTPTYVAPSTPAPTPTPAPTKDPLAGLREVY